MRSVVLALGLVVCCRAVRGEEAQAEVGSAEVGPNEMGQGETALTKVGPAEGGPQRLGSAEAGVAMVERGDGGWVIAVGEWSAQVEGLRGRLVIAQKYPHGDANYIETRVYVEFENSSAADSPTETIDLYFDPEGLACELVDAAGQIVPQGPGFLDRGRPGGYWVTLPFDSAMRLRVNPYGHGRERAVGLLIPLWNATWLVPAGAAGEYFLSGTFVVNPPMALARGNVWSGTLALPKMKVAAP
jgi:hypothetical protein